MEGERWRDRDGGIKRYTEGDTERYRDGGRDGDGGIEVEI